jgi:hypothetical protein
MPGEGKEATARKKATARGKERRPDRCPIERKYGIAANRSSSRLRGYESPIVKRGMT